MYAVSLPNPDPIVYSIFGIQHPTPTPSTTKALTTTLDNLLTNAATHTDTLTQDGPSPYKTTLRLTYWPCLTLYKKWWYSDSVSTFWSTLPNDAGIWREIITVPPARTQSSTNKTTPNGMGHLAPYTSITDKSGYWGCYYDRMRATSCSGEHLPSPLKNKKSPAIHRRKAPEIPRIRPGRTHLTPLPPNICFVVEGQDHSSLTPAEKTHWFSHFDKPVTKWIEDLQSSATGSGVLSTRLCYEAQSGKFRDSEPEALNYNRKIQLFYFLDMDCMERMGKMNCGHVGLRKEFLKAYGPNGEFAESGGICLWVETSILGEGELECEYVGCLEGTGLMGYEWDGN
ncbi:hypothetical protein BBP40_003830 [Aspergillus hancockii]|nr:hypothetical protein BBP40_003830 [Aspergillus hancockii]